VDLTILCRELWRRSTDDGGFCFLEETQSNYAKFLCDGLQQLADAVSLKTLAQ
jgi:hypothetical protein